MSIIYWLIVLVVVFIGIYNQKPKLFKQIVHGTRQVFNKTSQIKIPEMSISLFYKIGVICFIVAGINGMYQTIINWSTFNLVAKVSAPFGIIFSFVVALIFYQLSKTGGIEQQDIAPDLQDAIDTFKQNKYYMQK